MARAARRRGYLRFAALLSILALPLDSGLAHARKLGPGLPQTFVGQWSADKGKCDIQSESRLVIERDFVMFYAAGYSVKRIVRRPDGSLKIFGRRADEGEGGSTPDSIELKLVSPHELRTNGSDRPVYYRCQDEKTAKP
jgi:hypothetical protein